MTLKDLTGVSVPSVALGTNIKNFFKDIEDKTGIINFNFDLKPLQTKLTQTESGPQEIVVLEQEIDFFVEDKQGQEFYKFFNDDKVKYNLVIDQISSNPFVFFKGDYILIQTSIADFFSSIREFESDEAPQELSQDPQIRKRLFFNFINEIKRKSSNVIQLPYPPLMDVDGRKVLNESGQYRGFIDVNFGISLFNDYSNFIVARREGEIEKEQSFLNEFVDKVNDLVIEPERYVNSSFILKKTKSKERLVKENSWMRKVTNNSNLW